MRERVKNNFNPMTKHDLNHIGVRAQLAGGVVGWWVNKVSFDWLRLWVT